MGAKTCQFFTYQPFSLKDLHASAIYPIFRSPSPYYSKPTQSERHKPNWARFFQNTIIEADLFDFHKMEITVVKILREAEIKNYPL